MKQNIDYNGLGEESMKGVPDEIQAIYCYGPDRNTVTACNYYKDKGCPRTCTFATKLKGRHRNGLERFADKWGLKWR